MNPAENGEAAVSDQAQRGTKEVIVLAGAVLFLGGLLAAGWLYSQASDQRKVSSTTVNMEAANVSDLFKSASVIGQAEASTTHPTPITASGPDIIHADIYFEVGRKGLTDEGKAQLSAQADLLKGDENYGVLIQGYTDQQGSASYNKQLGMKRADTVKTELINAGIAEYRIKVVSLGEEGVLCVDTSDTCRHMNRRVHLEVRKIGQEHMVLPPAPRTSSEFSDSPLDPSVTVGIGDDSTTESIPPSPSVPATTFDPASGS